MWHRGTINGIEGSWGSGMCVLTLNGKRRYADNGPLCRALMAMFPDCRASGHCINGGVLLGREIEYQLDDMGLGMVAAIRPVPDCDSQ